MKELTDSTFVSETAEGASLVVFSAPWCAPCKALKPVVEKLEGVYSGFKFASVNADENPSTVSQFGIRGIPTTLILREGQVVETLTGAVNSQQLEKVLDRVANS